jgi:hypothetical protein
MTSQGQRQLRPNMITATTSTSTTLNGTNLAAESVFRTYRFHIDERGFYTSLR